MLKTRFVLLFLLIVGVGASATVLAQRGPGPRGGRGGPGFRGGQRDATFIVDREDFHFLLANHEKIRREVTIRKDGVETLTESDDPNIVSRIQKHVAAMYERVENENPIRRRDPLFAEIFRHANKIDMKFEHTDKGIRVVETSQDPYVASLIQEHAKVVSMFVKKGFEEAHKNHTVPNKEVPSNDVPSNDTQNDTTTDKVTCPADGCCGKKACCRDEECCCNGKCQPKTNKNDR